MGSPSEEFKSNVTDLETAKLAMSWAVERAQGLSLSIQSLKEQLGQKDHAIKMLQQDIFALQKNVTQAEFEKSEALQKVQSFKEEVTTLLVEVSEKEKEKLDLQRNHLEEVIAIERKFEQDRLTLLQEKERQFDALGRTNREELQKLVLESNRSANQLKEEFLKKEFALRDRERKHSEDFQKWRDQIYQEYAQKYEQLHKDYTEKERQMTLDYAQKELAFKATPEAQLSQTIEQLEKEKSELEKCLSQNSEDYEGKLRRKQVELEETGRILEEERSHWNNLLGARDQFFKEETEKTAIKVRMESAQKESSLKLEAQHLEQTLAQIQQDFLSKEAEWEQVKQRWVEEKQNFESQLAQVPQGDELAQRQEALKELEKRVKALSSQKEYLLQYTKMMQDRKQSLETQFTQFIKQLSQLKEKNGMARSEQKAPEQKTVAQTVAPMPRTQPVETQPSRPVLEPVIHKKGILARIYDLF